jgi:biotin-dependent carboxylase-like uncharacterized protein
MSALRIVQLGWGTTLQDRGRTGLADLGVPRAGAVDRRAHDLVNRLVGNPVGAATLETTTGLVVEAHSHAVVASSSDGALRTLRPGDRVQIDAAPGEMWGYLAVRGGFDVAPILGSRSHDTLSGLGPRALAVGDLLAVGPDPGTEMTTDLAPHEARGTVVRIWEGPQLSWFGSTDVLVGEWTVTAEVSRIGVRLERRSTRAGGDPASGSGIVLDAQAEQRIRSMSSEGIVEGAIQITPSGQPIVMLANHPTTGGYPVVAVVDPDDIPIAAQSRPGAVLRFLPV